MTELHVLEGAGGLRIERHAHGGLRRIDAQGVVVNAFIGDVLQTPSANLWLRVLGDGGVRAAAALLGPASPLALQADGVVSEGHWQGLALRLELLRADAAAAGSGVAQWGWRLGICNVSDQPVSVDVIAVQDVGLAEYAALRLNEYYVSQYIDWTPLTHERAGTALAARQNQPQRGRQPWALACAAGGARRFATDALQWHTPEQRATGRPGALVAGLPGVRLQHEHAMAALQTAPRTLAPAQWAHESFAFGVWADHPAASGAADGAALDALLRWVDAWPAPSTEAVDAAAPSPAAVHGTPFAEAPVFAVRALADAELQRLAPAPWRHVERAADGTLLSFFHDEAAHVVTHAKERAVHRPHGHVLRSGAHLVPDETALTSTVWMAGVFHSMLCQGHVSTNRALSAVRGWLGQDVAGGLRGFVVSPDGRWERLAVPSAFEMREQGCRWWYAHAGGLIELRTWAEPTPERAGVHAMGLAARAIDGPLPALKLTLRLALGGDDGQAPWPDDVPRWRFEADGCLRLPVPAGSELAQRFPGGFMRVRPGTDTRLHVQRDSTVFADARSRGVALVVLNVSTDGAPTDGWTLRFEGALLDGDAAPAVPLTLPRVPRPVAQAADRTSAGDAAGGAGLQAQAAAVWQPLADMLPWWRQNALVHYLSPRGLEQFSGGGWGTRDVCQGPLEALLALGHTAPARTLLAQVFAAQDASGDWPQWFMFFERDRQVRAGDSHGDIVFWPLLALARYLRASGDAGFLEEPLPFHAAEGARAEVAPVAAHVARALAVIDARRIPGTALAAYGHGDWNDSLQPADPGLRERLCSAWTVTLHHQTFTLLAQALREHPPRIGATGGVDAERLAAQAAAIASDFQSHLVRDGEVTGYALFDPGNPAAPELLLHPRDVRTGVRHSLLGAMHAVSAELLTPAQAADALALIEAHLTGPDGARLFDRPIPYRGGPQTLFQRAETAAFFGREIGVMYMHAHLRFAEMLAQLGEADRLWAALALAHPIGLHERVPSASRRQANCYYSSSDAAFPDRYVADAEYARVRAGTVALDGGWRVYSSGPGIALSVVAGHLLGLRWGARALALDPVMPRTLDGLVLSMPVPAAWRADAAHAAGSGAEPSDAPGATIDVHWRVGARGHGVQALRLGGEPLGFTRDANRYREGAALVARDEWLAVRQRVPGAVLEIDVG